MKKLFSIYTIALLITSIGLSSCVKKFDPKSYAPPLNINGYTSANQIAPSNLVARWGFNGNLTDSLATATSTTAVGTSYSAGLLGQALQGASSAYALSDVPPAVQNLHSFTFSVWVNMPQNTNGAVGLMDIANDQSGGPGFWGSMAIFFDNGGTANTGVLKVHAFNVAGSPTGIDGWLGGYTVNNPWGGWINVSVTYDDTTSTFVVYYNGGSVGTSTVTGFAPLNWTAAKKMVFGTLQFQTTPSLTANTGAQDWASYQVGATDEVRIYNRALTGVEVSSLVALQRRGK
ncbi:LamG-like jellyroll fold domain-containing protein [Mucilaginibacter sp. McL0603]|uniref:LamG-like jellyroll fold domain-containing protein n=1 Tax=Mucilaginibacter sp. McL0603 TaxID=3415670 RepID=UPI003CEE3460